MAVASNEELSHIVMEDTIRRDILMLQLMTQAYLTGESGG